MEVSHKVAIAVGVALMTVISLIGVSLTNVRAEELPPSGVKESYHIEVFNAYSDDVVEQYTFDMSLPVGQYPLFYAYDYQTSGVVRTYHAVELFVLDTESGIIKHAPSVSYRYVRYNGDDIQDSERSGNISVSSRLEYPHVIGAPVYQYDGSMADIYKDKLDEGVLNGEKMPISGSALWDKSNHYDKKSVYAPSNVMPPDVFYARLEYRKGSWKGSDDYEYTIKYRVGEMGEYDLTNYYTEIWAEVPVHDVLTGTTTSRKVFISSYKTADLFVRDLYKVDRYDRDTDTNVETGEVIDKGYHYEINAFWNDTFGRYIDASYATSYGGVTVYVRNAIYDGDNALVSGYCYFDFNPLNSYDDGNITYIDEPDHIYNHTGGSINENSGGDKKPDSDSNRPNHNDTLINGSDSSGSGGSSSVGVYVPSGKWTSSDFAEWTGNGFGLLGDGGIIALIGSLFVWLPADIFNLIFWSVLCGVVIAVIKLVF